MKHTEKMQIWVDADACPVVIKEILFRAAARTGIQVTLVANHFIHVPALHFIQVAAGFDVADNEIIRQLNTGDLVITGDIPLAAEIIEAGGHALSPRGELFSANTIKARLTMRDFLETMRSSGINSGGPPPLNQSDRQAFGNHLDRFLNQYQRQYPKAKQ